MDRRERERERERLATTRQQPLKLFYLWASINNADAALDIKWMEVKTETIYEDRWQKEKYQVMEICYLLTALKGKSRYCDP